MKTLGLADLLAPLTKEEFFNSYWPKKPLFIPATDGKFSKIFAIPQLKDLQSVIDARQKKVRACLPDHDDEYSSIHVDPQDALKVYNNSMTLVFDSMQTQDPTIASTLKNIRADLGLPTGGAENDLCKSRSIVYATPAGCGTRLHFDANINFVIQLSGSKDWTLTPNKSVENPTERFTALSFEMSAALEKQCHAPLLDTLDELPEEDLFEFTMEPGCVLFVPRGYWHETTTSEDSLSLNFTFSQPTWADIFTKSMQEHLLQSSEWRDLADGLESLEENRKAGAIKKFESLMKQLISELPKLNGKDLLKQSGLLE